MEPCAGPFFQASPASRWGKGWGISEPPTHMQMLLSPWHREPLPSTPPSPQRRKQGIPGRACSCTHPVRNQLAAASWGHEWLQARKPWKKEESSLWGAVPPSPTMSYILGPERDHGHRVQILKERWAEPASEHWKDSLEWGSSRP